MSMITKDSPRKLYTRKGLPVVCFDGKYFSPTGESAVDVERTVTCEPLKSDGKRARVEVTQKVKGKASIVETWRSVNLG